MFVPFLGFHVHVKYILLHLKNIGYQIMLHQLNQCMPVLKTVTIKIIEHYKDYIIMGFLYNKTPQLELDNIHELILAVISTNKE